MTHLFMGLAGASAGIVLLWLERAVEAARGVPIGGESR